jgi:hypothetical protein
MRDVTDPVAMATVRWLDPDRRVEPGSTMGATAVFLLGDDAEVIPGGPAPGQHHSVLMTFTDSRPALHEADAKIDFLDRAAIDDYLRDDAEFLVMGGPTPIGHATVTAVLWERDA